VDRKELYFCGMIVLASIKKNAQQFISLTTLTVQEFEILLVEFEKTALLFFETHNQHGQVRRRRFTFKKSNIFQSFGEMLFFILYYLKTNPLQ